MTVRVLHIITGLGTGGAETMLFRLISTLESSAFRNSVVSLMDEGTFGPLLRQAGVPVRCLALGHSRAGPRSLLQLWKLIGEVNPDVILAWMYHANLAATLSGLGRRRRVPVIWGVRRSLEGMEKEGRSTRLALAAGKALSFQPSRIIYNSRVSARQHEAYGYPADKTVVIPNGFDTEHFRPDPVLRTRVRAELGIDEATPLVGVVGRYHPAKDHENFLRAAHLVAREHPEVRFLLAGRETDTAAALQRLIADLELSGRVHAIGERRDVPAIMCGLDVLVSSSRTEGFPNAVGEAMACGVPCVVTDVGDSAWIVADTGRVVSPGAPAALARGIGELLHAGVAARRHFGAAARERVLANLSLEEVGRCYESLLLDYEHSPTNN